MKCIAILMFVAASIFPHANSQTITASMTRITHNSYAGIASQFHLTDLKAGGNQILGGEGYLICTDLAGFSLDEDSGTYPRITANLTIGTTQDMTVWSRYSNTQNESLARATAHWAIDTYYESHFVNPVDNASARQYAFQCLIWEIFGDAGTSSGLNFSNGNINRNKYGPYGTDSSPLLWSIMKDMLDATKASGINSSYIPKLEVLVALDSRSAHQDYLLLGAKPSLTIPEPSSSILIAIGLTLAFARRKRNP